MLPRSLSLSCLAMKNYARDLPTSCCAQQHNATATESFGLMCVPVRANVAGGSLCNYSMHSSIGLAEGEVVCKTAQEEDARMGSTVGFGVGKARSLHVPYTCTSVRV